MDSNPVIASLAPTKSALRLHVTSSDELASVPLPPTPTKPQDLSVAVWEQQEDRPLLLQDSSHAQLLPSFSHSTEDSSAYNTCRDELADEYSSSTGRSLASTFTKSVAEEFSSSHVGSISSHSEDDEPHEDSMTADSLAELHPVPVEGCQRNVADKEDPTSLSSSEHLLAQSDWDANKDSAASSSPAKVGPQESHSNITTMGEPGHSPGCHTHQTDLHSTATSPEAGTALAETSNPPTKAPLDVTQACQNPPFDKSGSTLDSFTATSPSKPGSKPRKSFFTFPDS